MMKTIIFLCIIFMLPGCAILGSENYFAARANAGKAEWAGEPDIMHITGKPDSIRYSKDGLEFIVNSSRLAHKTYSFGPCVPIPLPIIPMFGLYNTEYTGPVQISFHVILSKRPYKLIKAILLADNQALLPEGEVKIYLLSDGKDISHEAFLPLSLKDKSKYVLTYDIPSELQTRYHLDFIIQDESGSRILWDIIAFRQDKSVSLVCVP